MKNFQETMRIELLDLKEDIGNLLKLIKKISGEKYISTCIHGT